MNKDSKFIFENYKNIVEQKIVKIGQETIDIDKLINAIDKSNDLTLDIKNSLKSVLMSKMGSGQTGPMGTPSAMTQTPVNPSPMASPVMP